MTGGSIITENSNAIRVIDTGSFTMTAGTVESTSSTSDAPTLANEGISIIYGGTIKNNSAITSSIYVQTDATLTLGTNDSTLSTTNPDIVSANVGIDNKGTFNFYDGRIQGSTSIIRYCIRSCYRKNCLYHYRNLWEIIIFAVEFNFILLTF
jgi:hypothetical protein